MFEALPLWGHGLVMVAAFAALTLGAGWFVEAAARLAAKLDVSEVVVGLTVVAFGTSSPEFAVTLTGALRGQGDLAVGNVVGSNIFNLGFVLGGLALVRPMSTPRSLVRRDGLLLAGASLLLLVLVGWDLELGRGEGTVLFLILVVYLARMGHRQPDEGEEPAEASPSRDPRGALAELPALVLGLTAVVLGAQLLVGSASEVARMVGISEWAIGVTIIAAGTSMPELATAVVAVVKRRDSIGVGSLIGSDIFNILGVLGLAGFIHPVAVDQAARSSLLAMVGMVLLVLLFLRTGWRLSRAEGLILIALASMRWWLDLSARGVGA